MRLCQARSDLGDSGVVFLNGPVTQTLAEFDPSLGRGQLGFDFKTFEIFFFTTIITAVVEFVA